MKAKADSAPQINWQLAKVNGRAAVEGANEQGNINQVENRRVLAEVLVFPSALRAWSVKDANSSPVKR